MRTKPMIVAVAAAALMLLGGCASEPESQTETLFGAPPPPVEPSDARPDAEIPEADVPIADVAPEAQGINEGKAEQAEGIKMVPDSGRGLDAGDVSDTALAGGCLPDYVGVEGECLPPIPPRLAAEHAGHAGMSGPEMAMFYNCEDVRALIPDGVPSEKDPLGLDSNKDGVACGEGDKNKK